MKIDHYFRNKIAQFENVVQTCDEVCNFGTWGLDCTETCVCKNGAICLPVTGQCLCTPGWQGTECGESCEEGKFGQDCMKDCQCRNEALCNPVDGSCNCTSGFTGSKCEEVCSQGRWGYNCSQKCTCQNGASCFPDDGKCLCTPGWHGSSCDSPCSGGKYGQDCKEDCECRNGAKCNPVNGTCNCTSGFKGETIRFTNLCHEVEEVISSCKRKKWTEFYETLDPQKISQHWKVIKTLNNQSTHQKADLLTNIISSSGRNAATNKETASLLAKQFENKSKLTFNANDRKLLRIYRKTIQDSKRYNHKNIFTIPFLMEELEAAIAKMNPGKASGPDVIFGHMVTLEILQKRTIGKKKFFN
ncbi:multiple epidermal growth factor-like domains protein 10 [Trichonephila clavipes]|nr:multiple epidermal growth factor-like domains protein 10 [Trichonephila clavipes]